MVDHDNEVTLKDQALGSARSLIVRAAEAYGLRCILLALMQGSRRPVVLLGDLNDSAHSVTTTLISGTPPMLHLPEEKKQPIWDVLLYNAFDIQARQNTRRDVSYSHIFNGFYDTLDQIYVSQEFSRLNPERVGEVEYVHYFNDHLVDRSLSQDGGGRIQSDHGQVVATLRLRTPETSLAG
jgi:endonuclease/exonuclease/phosphatase family metal-dependent hydrolase